MTKRLVDIDDQLLERARAVSGEKTIRGTIEVALKKLTNHEVLMEHLRFLTDPDNGIDLDAVEEASRLRPSIPVEYDPESERPYG